MMKKSRRFFGVHKLKLPAFSPTMSEGKIVKWNLQVGEEIEEGDSVALIETDKASVDFEMTDPGYLAKIVKDENSGMIKVGEVIGYMVDEEAELENFNEREND